MIEMLNMDCMEYMATQPDNVFDLAIVDPPYNIVSQQKRGIGSRIDASGKMNGWNNIKPTPEYYEQLFRVSKCQIIWGANNFELPPTEYFIIWDKQQSVDNFASAEYAWTNCKMPAKVFRYSIHKTMSDRKSEGGKIHPTQKPVKLYNWLLQNYSEKGQRILDTHGGSFSSAIAAHYFGVDMVICEIDEDYFKAGKERFERETKQIAMF
jgi:site-specific DNA-methyltransferase (adenine-specific)